MQGIGSGNEPLELAALSGSVVVAPIGNIDPERPDPFAFEPIHGSSFDVTGKGIASKMLERLGEADAANRLMPAAGKVCADGILTPGVGGKATTQDATDAVCDAIRMEEI